MNTLSWFFDFPVSTGVLDHWNDFRCSYRYRDIRQGTLETVTQGIAYKEEQTYDKKHIGTGTGF